MAYAAYFHYEQPNFRRHDSLRGRHRIRGAFDLTELALYLVAGIILLIGIIALFSNVFTSTKCDEAQIQFVNIVDDVENLYGSEANYAGLSTASLISSGQLPKSWIQGGTMIMNPYKGQIVVSGWGTVANIEDTGLSQAACVAIATTPIGTPVTAIGINALNSQTSFTPAQAQAQCSNAGNTNEVGMDVQ